MYEEFADMLVEFGIPLLVYLPANGEGGHLEHGTWVKDSETPPVEVSEPLVVPSKTSLYSMEVQHNAGGETQSYDAVWYSTMEAPKGTVVENKRTGRKYVVDHEQDYTDYSDVHEYDLKGVSNHD